MDSTIIDALSGNISWSQSASILFKILAAFLLTLPVAWERERTTQRVGLRTFPMVAVASCGYMLLGMLVLGPTSDAQARIIQGLMTGIGFVGGGAILKEGGTVRGTSTAASIWTTGIIGASIAYEYYTIAIIVSIVNYLAFRLLTPLVHRIDRAEEAAKQKQQQHQEQEQEEPG